VVAGVVRHRAPVVNGARRADCACGRSAGVGAVWPATYWPPSTGLLPSSGPLLVVLAIGLGALWLPWVWLSITSRRADFGTRTLAAVLVLPSAWVTAEAVRSFAESRRSMGLARRVAVEPAGHARLGLARRRLAHQFRDRRVEHRNCNRDPAAERSCPRSRGSGWHWHVRGSARRCSGWTIAPCGVDGTGGARPTRQHRGFRAPSIGERSADRRTGRPAAPTSSSGARAASGSISPESRWS
jgi:hypothetical protein